MTTPITSRDILNSLKDMTSDELRTINEALCSRLKARRAEAACDARDQLRVGSTVEFTAAARSGGGRRRAKVTKIMRTRCKGRCEQGYNWTLQLSNLTIVEY
jgi:hypothetical protein